jgi:hypothetical protein
MPDRSRATSTPSCLPRGAQRGPRRCRFVVLYNNGPALRVSALQIEAIMPESVPATGTDSVCMAKPRRSPLDYLPCSWKSL